MVLPVTALEIMVAKSGANGRVIVGAVALSLLPVVTGLMGSVRR